MTTTTTEELEAKLEKALASISRLETKNSELIDREKAAKKAADEAEAAREEAATEAAAKAGDVDTIRTQLEKKHAAEIKRLSSDLADRDNRLTTLLIDNAVSDAIAKNGVRPVHVRAVTLMLKDGVKMENGEPVANGVPLADHIADFFRSSEANEYVEAAVNTGAGAAGSTARAGRWTKPPVTSAELLEWDKGIAADPAYYNGLADSFGRPDLKA